MRFASHRKTFAGEANREITYVLSILSCICDSFKSLFSPHQETDDSLDLCLLDTAAGDVFRRKLMLRNNPMCVSLYVFIVAIA